MTENDREKENEFNKWWNENSGCVVPEALGFTGKAMMALAKKAYFAGMAKGSEVGFEEGLAQALDFPAGCAGLDDMP